MEKVCVWNLSAVVGRNTEACSRFSGTLSQGISGEGQGRMLSPLRVLMTHAYHTHIPHAHETVQSVLCREAIRELKRD